MNILLGILTFILILVSLFLVLVVLAQKAKGDAGMGAAMGGGMAEAAFGADTGNVLSKATINAAIAFFVLALALYLGRLHQRTHPASGGDALPTIAAPAAVKPIAPAPSAPAKAAPGATAPATNSAATPAPATEKKP